MGEAPLAVARLHQLESGVSVDYEQSTAEEFAELHAGTFDVVTCLEMLEHVPDPSSVIRACAKLVKPGGQVFFSTINRNPKSFMFAIVGAEYVLREDVLGSLEPGRKADLTLIGRARGRRFVALAGEDAGSIAAICEGDAAGFFEISRAEADRRRLCGLLATRPRTTDSIFGVVLGQPLQFLFGAFDRAAAAADNIGYILNAILDPPIFGCQISPPSRLTEIRKIPNLPDICDSNFLADP